MDAAVALNNSSSNTSLAEPGFYNSPLAQQLTSQFGEKFKLATGRSAAGQLPG